MDTLPLEILDEIQHYLPNPDFAKFRRISKRYNLELSEKESLYRRHWKIVENLYLLSKIKNGDKLNTKSLTVSRGWFSKLARMWNYESRSDLRDYLSWINEMLRTSFLCAVMDEKVIINKTKAAIHGLRNLQATYRGAEGIEMMIEEKITEMSNILEMRK